MKPGMCIMSREATSTTDFINPSHRRYQQCSFSNCIVLLTSLRVHTTVFLACIRYSDWRERNQGDWFFPHPYSIMLWGSHSGGYEEFCLLSYNFVWSVDSHLTFRRNTLPLSSVSKNKLNKKSAWKQVASRARKRLLTFNRLKTKIRGFSPQANCTDWATAACQRS
jgi:hypothetical protein